MTRLPISSQITFLLPNTTFTTFFYAILTVTCSRSSACFIHSSTDACI